MQLMRLEIQRWPKLLNTESKLAWTTIAKMRGIMSRIYKVGILHERVTKNPVLPVETRYKTNYRAIVITPTRTFNILKSLTNNLHHTLVLTCAATGLRSSEILALRWADRRMVACLCPLPYLLLTISGQLRKQQEC
ncbi:MAG: hypothetical protein WBD73_03120 [Candidatus Acidiferrales bacterium]